MAPKLPEHTDWLALDDQQFWFDQFKSLDANGLKFNQFQEFLKSTIYKYFSSFPSEASASPAIKTSGGDNNNKKSELDRPTDDNRHESRLPNCSSSSSSGSAAVQAYNCTNDTFTRQQEMQLFKVFDVKNDHVIDREEFGVMCSKWLNSVYNPICGLVIVDVQNDFIDGSLALINGPAGQDGAQVVPIINNLIDKWQECCKTTSTIVYTQDWHPSDHIGFHANLHMRKYTLKQHPCSGLDQNNSTQVTPRQQSNGAAKEAPPKNADARQQVPTTEAPDNDANENNGKDSSSSSNRFKYKKFLTEANLFDTVLFEDGRIEQKLWPTHCVQNSWGAQLHPKLKLVPDAIRILKGTLSHVDAYSAFWDNMHVNETGLRQELMSKRVTDLFFCGLALEFCVAASALDAAKTGFVTFVIEDACRGIDEQEIEHRKRELLDNGVFIIQSDTFVDYLVRQQQTIGINNLNRNLIKAITYRRALLL